MLYVVIGILMFELCVGLAGLVVAGGLSAYVLMKDRIRAMQAVGALLEILVA